ncbi:MAG: DUF6737 family protein [Prochlorococcaceae cyanobacterium]|jgi:hypothetical protein
MWQEKPWWCQPWSIVLTGVALVGGSWWLWRRWWVSAPLAVVVLLWWWLFLVLAPAAYRLAAEQAGQAGVSGERE